jgi:hypothetical protein
MSDELPEIDRLRDPYERFIFQGGSQFANNLADLLSELQWRRTLVTSPSIPNERPRPCGRTKSCTVTWHRSWSAFPEPLEVTVPAGLRVVFLPDPSGGRYVLDDFPFGMFPVDSILRWDAIHYGLPIPEEYVRCDTPTS